MIKGIPLDRVSETVIAEIFSAVSANDRVVGDSFAAQTTNEVHVDHLTIDDLRGMKSTNIHYS